MAELLSYFKNIITSFAGDGFFVVAGIICILIMFMEKEHEKKCNYMMFILMIGLMNPITIWICGRFLFDNDARVAKVLMAIPLFVAISYVVVKYCKKWYHFVLCTLLICIFGTCILTKGNFQKADNWYKLERRAVDVCDFIEKTEIGHDDMIKCLVDEKLAPYIRQYDPRIVLGFGRWEYSIEEENPDSALYQMKSSEVDSKILAGYALAWGMEYIVLPGDRTYTEPLDNYGYLFWGEVSGYCVYHNMSIHNTHLE